MQKEVYEFISKQTNDPIIEWRTCAISGEEFAIFQSDKEFYDKISPTFDGQAFQIPFPDISPLERSRRRMLFRNERKFYHDSCKLSWKPILTMFDPEQGYTVYDNSIRWSDQWDSLSYWITFDTSLTFVEQFRALMKSVPHPAVFNTNSENSLYCGHVGYMKNAFLTTASWDCKDIYYSSKCVEAYTCFDLTEWSKLEQCYQCIQCENSYKLFRWIKSKWCRESYLLYDCENCESCFWCRNLIWKKYCYFNKQLDKDEYLNKIAQNLRNREKIDSVLLEWNERVNQDSIFPSSNITNSTDVWWDQISNSSNCYFCYNVYDISDAKYSENVAQVAADIQDVYWAWVNLNKWYEIIDAWVFGN